MIIKKKINGEWVPLKGQNVTISEGGEWGGNRGTVIYSIAEQAPGELTESEQEVFEKASSHLKGITSFGGGSNA